MLWLLLFLLIPSTCLAQTTIEVISKSLHNIGTTSFKAVAIPANINQISIRALKVDLDPGTVYTFVLEQSIDSGKTWFPLCAVGDNGKSKSQTYTSIDCTFKNPELTTRNIRGQLDVSGKPFDAKVEVVLQ